MTYNQVKFCGNVHALSPAWLFLHQTMSWWRSPIFNSLNESPPSPSVDGTEVYPDFYQLLDPSYMKRRIEYDGVYSRYQDARGALHHSTYRPFPPLTPSPKRISADERPTYVERMRLPEPEPLPPTIRSRQLPWVERRERNRKRLSFEPPSHVTNLQIPETPRIQVHTRRRKTNLAHERQSLIARPLPIKPPPPQPQIIQLPEAESSTDEDQGSDADGQFHL
jgi:hypothetical protein